MNRHRRKLFSWTVITGLIFNLISPLFLLPWQQVWACFGSWDCGGNAYCAGAGSYPDHPGSCASYGERGNNDRTTSEIARDYINNGGNPAEVVTRTSDFQGALSNNNAAEAAAAAQQLAAAEAQRIAAEQAAAANAAAAAATAKAADDKAKAESQRLAQEAAERSARAAANAAAAATAMTAINPAVPGGTPAAGATVPAAAAPAAAVQANCGSSLHNACSPNSDGNWYRCDNGSWQKADDCKPAGAITCAAPACAGANGCIPEGTPAVYNGVEKVCGEGKDGEKGRWIDKSTVPAVIPQKPNLAEAIDATLGDFAGGAALKISPSPTARPIAAAPTTAVAPPTSAPIPTAPTQQTAQEQNLERFRCEERGGTWTNDNTCQSPGRPSPTIAPNPAAAIRRPVNPTLIPAPPTPVPTAKQPDYPDESRFTGLKIPTPLPTNRPAGQVVLPDGYRCSESGGELIDGECRAGVKTETETVRIGGGKFGQTATVTTKTFCSGNSVVTQTNRSDGAESSDSTVCEWGCSGGACRPPTIQETAVVRMEVINNAIDLAKVRCGQQGKKDCSTVSVYQDAMANMDPEEPSPYQVAIRNSGTTAVQRETLIQAEYNKLLREQVELASMGEAGAGMIAGPIDQAGLRQQAERKVDETIAAYKLSEGGGNTPAAVGRSLDKIGELSAEEAQGQIDQQGWLYGTIIAKPMFCGMNNNYRASGACGIEHVSVLNEEGLESARAYWTFLITGRTEQALQDLGMIIGDPRSPGFQGRDYNANVALPCGVRSSEGEEEVTDEELACLKGKNVEAQFRLAEVDRQNQTNAVLNVVAAGAGFAGGAIVGGAKAASLVGKAGLFLVREGMVSDVALSPLFAETTTAGQRAGADALAALATAPDLTQTERETLSELAAQADEEADRAYTENLLMNAASTFVIGAAGSGAGRAAREVFGDTPLGRLLLGDLPPAARQGAAQEVANALNNEVIAPASLFPGQVNRQLVSAEEVLAGINKAKAGLSGNTAEALASPGVVAGANVPVGGEVGGVVTTVRTASRQNSGFIAEVKQGVGQIVSEGEIAITDVGRTLEKGVDNVVINAAETVRSATQAAGEAIEAAKINLTGRGRVPAEVAVPEPGTFATTSIRDSAVAIQPLPIENVPRRIIDPNTLTDQIDPKLSSSADVYKLKLEIDGTETPVVVKVYRFSDARTPMAFPNEINRAQIADQLGIGPRFHGIADLGDGRLAYIVDEVPGVTSKGAIAGQDFGEYVTRQTLEDVRTIEARLADNGFAVSGDFEFMITPDGRAVVIDPSAIIPEPSSSRLTQTGGIMDDKIRILMKARAESQGLPGSVANAIDSWSGASKGRTTVEVAVPGPRGVGDSPIIYTPPKIPITESVASILAPIDPRGYKGVYDWLYHSLYEPSAKLGGQTWGDNANRLSQTLNDQISTGARIPQEPFNFYLLGAASSQSVRETAQFVNAVPATTKNLNIVDLSVGGFKRSAQIQSEYPEISMDFRLDDIRSASFPQESADVISADYVFNFIPREQWLSTLANQRYLLKQDGILAIAFEAKGSGVGASLENFLRQPPRIDEITAILHSAGYEDINVELISKGSVDRYFITVKKGSSPQLSNDLFQGMGGGGAIGAPGFREGEVFGPKGPLDFGWKGFRNKDTGGLQFPIGRPKPADIEIPVKPGSEGVGGGEGIAEAVDLIPGRGETIFGPGGIRQAVSDAASQISDTFNNLVGRTTMVDTVAGKISTKGEIEISVLKPHEPGYNSYSVRELGKLIDQGVVLDPVLITEYNGKLYTYDGANRITALQRSGKTTVNYEFTPFDKVPEGNKAIIRTVDDKHAFGPYRIPESYDPAEFKQGFSGEASSRVRKAETPIGIEKATDDLFAAAGLPCNLITFRAGIPQVYAGSRDPCPITLLGPNGPAAKAGKAVKDLFGGEELPARTISPADENIAETIQPFFKAPLSDSPQSTVGRIGGGTTTATVVGAADNPTAVVLQSQSGLITVKPAVDQPLTVKQARGIIAQLKNDNPNGFAVSLPTQRQGLIDGRTFGDILSSEGLVADVNGRLTWIPDIKPREIKAPKGYSLAQAESDGIQYFSVQKDGQTVAVVAYDPNSKMILDVKSNSGAEMEAVQTVVNHLSGKQDFAGVEISGWLSRDQATAQALAELGLAATPAGRYTYLLEFIPQPNPAQKIAKAVVLTGAGILALVGLDQLANQPEAEPVTPLEIGKIPPEYADLELKPVDEEVIETPLVAETALPQVGPELEAYLRTEMAEFKEIQEAMQDPSIIDLIDRKLDEMDQLPDNEPIKDPETIALLGTLVGFEEIYAEEDWTVGEVRTVLEALKSIEPMEFLLSGLSKVYFVKVHKNYLPANLYGRSVDCKIFNQPDDEASNRCVELYIPNIYSDISQFKHNYQDADFAYGPEAAKVAHEIGHVLQYQRKNEGFVINPVYRRFVELFYEGRQVSVPDEESGGELQVLFYYPPAVLEEGAPTAYSMSGGTNEDWADSVALFTNAHDAFCDQRPLRCGYLACVASGTPSAQCNIVEKDENGKVRVIPSLEEAGMGIEQSESGRLSQ